MTHTDLTSNGNLPDGTVAVVVVAAGSGERLGAGVPKAFVELGGKTLLERSVEQISQVGCSVELVIVAPADYVEQVAALVVSQGATVVAGGASRHESVAAGLAVISDSAQHVLIHDAARALAPAELFDDVIGVLRAGARAVVPGLKVVDTVKRVDSANGGEQVVETVDRSTLRAIQTPQGFDLGVLRELHAGAPAADVTDDAGLAEAAGVPVVVIEGSVDAFKITTPRDLEYAEFVLNSQESVS